MPGRLEIPLLGSVWLGLNKSTNMKVAYIEIFKSLFEIA